MAEFLNAFSRTPELRHAAALTVRSILNDVNTVVVPQSHSGFLEALNRFERRRDKNYSLVDCHSMNIMESEGIDAVLTNDHHFQQEGFTVLIRRAD